LTEIVARLPRSRGPLRALQVLVLLGGLALLAYGVNALRPHARTHAHRAAPAATPGTKRGAPARLANAHAAAAEARVAAVLGRDAGRAFDRGIFQASPGGVVATAVRVAQWHRLVVRATRRSGFSPALVEAMIFVESSGRADVSGGSAVGLTQLRPATARHFGLRVKLGQSERLTYRLSRAVGARHSRQLRRWRARYDQRFSPARSVVATVRYLEAARRTLGRADLAVASYHLGIVNLRRAVALYGGRPSFAQLYFGSAPDRHPRVWRRVGSYGDYYWKVLAAQHVMRLFRRDSAALTYLGSLQARKNSAEEVLHPRAVTARFASPAAIARARRQHVLRAIPRNVSRTHIALTSQVGAEAPLFRRSRRLYAALRPATLDVLLYIGSQVHTLSGARRLLVTSAVRDNRYQRVLMRVNANAARTYSIHTTGYAFDIARSYTSGSQARAFQFVLDRLTAVGAIAYIREATAIHVAVASDAQRKLALLARS
jgi:soluble lytic murein transglycosylase-like protein